MLAIVNTLHVFSNIYFDNKSLIVHLNSSFLWSVCAAKVEV